MKFDIIFAINNDYLFGIDNRLPWQTCKDDLEHYNKVTTDSYDDPIIVMGKNTWESLPNKLNKRIHIVISKSLEDNQDKYIRYNTLEDFINNHKTESKIFIIGGKSLIEEALTKYKYLVENVHMSIVQTPLNDGINKVYLNKDIILGLEPYLYRSKDRKDVTFYHYKLPKHEEYQYLNLLQNCINNGERRMTRNAYTYSYFNDTISFDLTKGFPLLTTKKMFVKGIFEELIFFLKGQTDSKILESKGVNIWKGNTTQDFINKCGLPYKEGDMGPMYGWQWKHFGAKYTNCDDNYENQGFDQIKSTLDLLIKDPHSRRIIISDYNPSQAHEGVLYPCHSIVIQLYCNQVNDKKMISMNMYQRSVDGFLGLPFNIASNALLLHLICNTLNKIVNADIYYPYKLNIIMGDIHVYEDHLEQVKEQLKRMPFTFPNIKINRTYYNLEDYKWEDIEFVDYQYHPPIKANMVA